MKIKIRSEEANFTLWLPLSLIKSRLILGIIARSTAKKRRRDAEDAAAGITDADEIAEAAADVAEDAAEAAEETAERVSEAAKEAEKEATEHAANAAGLRAASVVNSETKKKSKAAFKTAVGKIEIDKILNPKFMREIYKILKKHKGLTLMDVHSADGDIVQIKI